MHFDNLGLSGYYFIDPHWLYHVFCEVCTSPMLSYSSKIDSKFINYQYVPMLHCCAVVYFRVAY